MLNTQTCTINEALLDKTMLMLGFSEALAGTHMLRDAVRISAAQPGIGVVTGLYPEIARIYGSTAPRVERCIRHAIERAWSVGDPDLHAEMFGNSVDPSRGKPRNSEFIARMVRICS